jgi:galactokinase
MEDSLIRMFREIYQSYPEVYSSAPGRINIIGEHTDYNLGYVLPSAIHLRTFFLAARRKDRKVRVWASNLNQGQSFSIDKLSSCGNKGWIDYMEGIYWVLKRRGASLDGIDALVYGNIPLGSGLSSSAAYEVSVINALDDLCGLNIAPLEMARLAQKAENDFVGVRCGLMDQFVSVFGQKNQAIFLDCEKLEFAHIPLRLDKERLGILVYDTGIRRELASSEYNKRRLESAQALKVLKKSGVRNYKNLTLHSLRKKGGELKGKLFKRARHVVTENQRVQQAVSALQKDDFEKLGGLLFQSHESLRDDYEVSCPELDLLYECGKRFAACLGARLTGAGFGGSGIALVKKDKIPAFKQMLLNNAKQQGYPQPAFHEVAVGEGKKIHECQLRL